MKSFLFSLLVTVFSTAPLPAQETPRRPARATKSNVKAAGDYQADAAVVRESQEQAIEMAQALAEKAKDPKAQAAIEATIREMERALKLLAEAKDSPAKLQEAVAAEQAAYASLLKLAAREHQVMRSKKSKSGKQGEQSQREREMLENLDLPEEKNRYETQKQAKPAQTPEAREQLQVLNRLKELAQRQQDLNERLKELQNALQEAKNETEKEDIRRRLKRLREEEQQMLADVDELKQRMEKPENQSRMADEKKQLDQTRDQLQKAAESLDKGAVPQALVNGTRAERDLQKLRDDFRKKNSNEFTEEMRQMRAEARELAQKQEEITQKLEATGDTKRKSLTDSVDRKELTKQLDAQKERYTNLVEHATRLTETAENAEPLLAKQLYDTLRKTAQADANNVKQTTAELLQKGTLTQSLYDRLKKTGEEGEAKSIEATAELVKQNLLPQAGASAQKARKTIEEFKGGVERAAESVLGSEAEALRAARKQLDALKEQLDRAIAANDSNAKPGEGEPKETTAKDAKSASEGKQPGEGEPNSKEGKQAGKPSEQAGKQPGKGEGKQGKSEQAAKESGAGEGKSDGKQTSQSAQSSPGKGETQSDGKAQEASSSRGGSPQRSSANRAGVENFLNGGGGGGGAHLGPIYGEDFNQWSDRLREVEEMIDVADLRNEVSRIREDARELRLEARKPANKPDWAVVQTKIARPLAEVRQRIADELAKRESKEALVPIDRDPVPGKFSDLVRRYYQELGKSE